MVIIGKSKGYVSIWRDIQDHELWTSETFSKGQAWIDLILMANHEDKTILMGNEVVKAVRGSVITSELKLMTRWKWSKKKLRSYLSLLEELEMIEKHANRKYTTIFIRNYSEHQKKETAKETDETPLPTKDNTDEETAKETTKRPRRDHEETAKDTQTININNLGITKNKERYITRHKYGEYGNVILSDGELEKLKGEYPLLWERKLEELSSYMERTGRTYNNHYATIKNWIKKDETKRGEVNGEEGERGKPFEI